MPAPLQNSTPIAARIVPAEKLEKFDTLRHKLMCAEGVAVALMNTFDEESWECMMPGEKLHQALYALSDLVKEARDLAVEIT